MNKTCSFNFILPHLRQQNSFIFWNGRVQDNSISAWTTAYEGKSANHYVTASPTFVIEFHKITEDNILHTHTHTQKAFDYSIKLPQPTVLYLYKYGLSYTDAQYWCIQLLKYNLTIWHLISMEIHGTLLLQIRYASRTLSISPLSRWWSWSDHVFLLLCRRFHWLLALRTFIRTDSSSACTSSVSCCYHTLWIFW